MSAWAKLTSRLPWIISQADREVQIIIEEAILDIEREAKARSRVDTGTMQGGWTAEMTGKHQGTVYNLVEHTIFNEYGTVNMTAQPMLTPAIRAIEPWMLDRIEEVYR